MANSALAILKRNRWAIAALFIVLAIAGITEYFMGRLPLGPDGRFGWWDGNIWGSENSQRFADAYSFSHIAHGIIFFALLWAVARNKLSVQQRFMIALVLEACWELLENSPLIINRYRSMTIAQGYVGDSILNSMSDFLMMCLGFVIACLARPWMSVVLILIMEIGCAIWIRDNLTLNVIMLIHPVEAIKHWQMAGQPGH